MDTIADALDDIDAKGKTGDGVDADGTTHKEIIVDAIAMPKERPGQAQIERKARTKEPRKPPTPDLRPGSRSNSNQHGYHHLADALRDQQAQAALE